MGKNKKGKRGKEKKERTKLGEISGGEGVGVVLVVVSNGEEGGVELLELHKVFVPHSVQRYLNFAPSPHSRERERERESNIKGFCFAERDRDR